jgi:hypothetical protein
MAKATMKIQQEHLNGVGWELVNVFDTNVEGGKSRHVIAILKRPKE